MPKISKQFTLEIKPTRFLRACSNDEIYEIWLLLSESRYQTILKQQETGIPVKEAIIDTKVPLPFSSDAFAKAWAIWKEYKRKEHGFRFKTDISERGALKRLAIDSDHNEQRAIAIINRSIEKGWSGLFPLPAGELKTVTKTTRKNFGQ